GAVQLPLGLLQLLLGLGVVVGGLLVEGPGRLHDGGVRTVALLVLPAATGRRGRRGGGLCLPLAVLFSGGAVLAAPAGVLVAALPFAVAALAVGHDAADAFGVEDPDIGGESEGEDGGNEGGDEEDDGGVFDLESAGLGPPHPAHPALLCPPDRPGAVSAHSRAKRKPTERGTGRLEPGDPTSAQGRGRGARPAGGLRRAGPVPPEGKRPFPACTRPGGLPGHLPVTHGPHPRVGSPPMRRSAFRERPVPDPPTPRGLPPGAGTGH